jgi:hypothetical protein
LSGSHFIILLGVRVRRWQFFGFAPQVSKPWRFSPFALRASHAHEFVCDHTQFLTVDL